MAGRFAALTYTPAVLAIQKSMGSHAADRLRSPADAPEPLTADEVAFLAERDSFYMATVNASGWPYLQHRGGPKGFLHALDEHTLAFADVSGNRQYLSTGNLATDDRVALFLMDYPNRTRLKLLAHATVTPWHEKPEALRQALPLPARARPERVITLHVEAFDWNCPQGITPRWTSEEILASNIGQRLEELQQENAQLREDLAAAQSQPKPNQP